MIDSTGGIRLNHGLIFFHHSALLTNDWVFSFPLSTDYGCKRFRIVLLIYCLQIMSKSSSQRVCWYGIRLWYEVYLTWFFLKGGGGGYTFFSFNFGGVQFFFSSNWGGTDFSDILLGGYRFLINFTQNFSTPLCSVNNEHPLNWIKFSASAFE